PIMKLFDRGEPNRILLQIRALVDAGEARLGPRGLDGLPKAAATFGPKFVGATGGAPLLFHVKVAVSQSEADTLLISAEFTPFPIFPNVVCTAWTSASNSLGLNLGSDSSSGMSTSTIKIRLSVVSGKSTRIMTRSHMTLGC
ncbi:MAG: hypothetical protein AABZ64_01260, partial [Nitrospinota bacterium]